MSLNKKQMERWSPFLLLMAIITTLMASPLFERVYGRKARARGELGGLKESDPELPGITERQRA